MPSVGVLVAAGMMIPELYQLLTNGGALPFKAIVKEPLQDGETPVFDFLLTKAVKVFVPTGNTGNEAEIPLIGS